MRLYPPAWTLGRQALTDYAIDKYVIPSGSIILMSQYAMHRNPNTFQTPKSLIRIAGQKNSNLSCLVSVTFRSGEASEDVWANLSLGLKEY